MRSAPCRTRRTPTAPRTTPRAAPPALAALVASVLLAGCSSAWEGARGGAAPAAAGAHDVFLQPLAAPGPDPFTASTARTTARPSSPPKQPDPEAERAREVTGSTPGLYGGTRAEGSCDVERQVSYLAADQDRTRAFAEAAGIPETNVGEWLRGLTPVVLRADTRVTNHGYRKGRVDAFQAVLQTGTAVLVDQYGAPRVRCACGNPLRTPTATPEGVHRGDPWDGFDPDHVIVVRPTTTVVTSLVIVNAVDRTWIERRTGSDGDEDRKPAVAPACDPDECRLTGSGTPEPPTPEPPTPDPSAPERRPSPDTASPETPSQAPVPPAPESPASPDASGSGGTDTAPSPADPDPDAEPYPDPYTDPDTQPYPDPYTDPDTQPYPDPYTDPDTQPYPDPDAEPSPDPDVEPPGEPSAVPDGELPSEELFPAGPVPDQPETFEG